MKKILAVATLVTALPFSNMALADQDIGCGLGSMVFEGKSGKVSKVLGATTNGTSGNQTFGITFGTLGCDGTGTVTSSEKLAMFIDGNMDNLARDMAKGEGETLATLSEVWGIQQADQAEFNSVAQENFAAIFSSENVTSQEVLVSLNTLIAQDATLADYRI
ncbi:DUF3015 domain-containing protein [Oceanisphaera pacifica]|uniref:DUF3015 domain-containing protein n=1 Tax=Oceanisphaera pacifica TaxID=2818389 RepID=A0ABS3NHA0_9GAMM|nr:DUF3015 domain-containing protein [Oceanisphaera pacifica]MBO1519942.1 DUF3015 domain-containing protein [Oceanisphaera pacifica]